jgi:hypothetical protein
MTPLEELILSAKNLCHTLDKASGDEKSFSYNVCGELERMSWETMRIVNDLKAIREYVTGHDYD